MNQKYFFVINGFSKMTKDKNRGSQSLVRMTKAVVITGAI